jgi:hypothetical protein
VTKFRTHYDNLQVAEHAGDEVIRAAYKYLSQKWHPDKHPSDRERAERIMKMINHAYRVLSTPELRREHDEWIARQRASSANNFGGDQPTEPVTEPVSESALPAFGLPYWRWWGKLKPKGTFPTGYAWMAEKSTLLVCAEHFVLLRGAEKRSTLLDGIGMMPAGIVVGLVRGLADKASYKKFNFPPDIAKHLYEERDLVWCKKSDSEIWRYLRKSFLGLAPPAAEQLFCTFNSLAGVIRCTFPLCDPWEAPMQEDTSGLGCKTIVCGRDLRDRDLFDAMEQSLLDIPD